MSPLAVTGVTLSLWALSWLVASVWSRRTQARPPAADFLVYAVPTAIGGILLALSGRAQIGGATAAFVGSPFWRPPAALGWLLFGLGLVGLAFTWWARLTLGSLWSSSVTRKEAHVIVEAGPYRIVRHPIYTGLILALAAFAVQLGSPAALVGVGFMVLGFWLKARLEERFLGAELGEAAYADYRRRTPMLVPFWPAG